MASTSPVDGDWQRGPADFPAYTDRATLAGTGTFTCNGVLPSTLTWSLAGQN